MIKEIIVTLLNQGKNGLVDTFNAVPEDKLTWKPMDNGRTALDALSECAQIAGMIGGLAAAKGQLDPTFDFPAYFKQMREERQSWDKTQALEKLEANHSALIAGIEALTDEEIGAPVTMPIRGGVTNPLGVWLMMASRNYVARFAQINYIQTLYGDFDSH